MKILCTADLHMGRRSSRLPDAVDGRACSCTASWSRIVEQAIETGADVVAIAGDVVDRRNRYYEAIGPLERGVRRLAEAGIPVVAVAGNHDFDVLPALADALDSAGFHLVGRGGRWERITVETRSAGPLAIDGWSFPAEHVVDDPLAGYALGAGADGVPLLGLLHADLGQPGSAYAPVTLAGLRTLPPRFWLLGHVHAPALHRDEGNAGAAAPVLYPGSPQAMDPGEPGPHGAWLVETEPGGAWRARALPLSTVRYERVEVDVGGLDDEDALRRRVVDAVRARLAEAVEDGGGALRWLCCRIALTGRTPLHGVLARVVERLPDDLELSSGEAAAVVDAVELESRPALDIDALARERGPRAVLARALGGALAESGGGAAAEPYRGLVRRAVEAARDVYAAPAYRVLPDEPPSEAEVRRILGDGAWLLLDALQAQREGRA